MNKKGLRVPGTGGRAVSARGWRRVAMAALAGGSLCQTCETRLRDAFVHGTQDYIRALLDPTNVLGLLIEETTGADETATEP